jgi:hypothetical protein
MRPLSKTNVPNPRLHGSNNISPGCHVRTVPNRRNRVISAGASLGNICSRRDSRLGGNGKSAVSAEMSSTFKAASVALSSLLISFLGQGKCWFLQPQKCKQTGPGSKL